MCGFVVCYHPRGGNLDEEVLKRMCDSMVHRGPDHYGVYRDDEVTFGHRRLKIIDLSDDANQPMVKDDRVLVYNGEIYNYQRLRQELEKDFGVQFRTNSDSEVVLESYAHWGPECVSKFNGMFAFAIWDRSDRTLFVARDRLGVKPLFFVRSGGGYIFASDLKAIWESIPLSGRLNVRAVYSFLIQSFISEPATATEGVDKFPPATYWSLGPTGERRVCYWDLNQVSASTDIPFEEAVHESESLLRDAVRLRLRSDVPVGCFLSGGVDSSLVSALAASELGPSFHTHSIGFNVRQYDESMYARQVAARYGFQHHHKVLDSSCLEILPELVWNYSELFGDASALPSYLVSREAKKDLTVVLTGDGGDEAFGGYIDPFAVYLNQPYRRVPALLRKALGSVLGQARARRDHSLLRRLERFNEISFQGIEEIYSGFKSGGWAAYSESFGTNGDVPRANLDYLRACASQDPVDKLLYADISERLPFDFLVKVDMATMANSQEARSPFLDYRVIEWGHSLSHRVRYRHFRRKAVLKKVAEKYLDHELIYRRKMGFSIPQAEWLREDRWLPVVSSLILRPSVLHELVSLEVIKQVLEEFARGQVAHSNRIWLLLWFQLWEGLFISGIYQPDQPLSETVG